LFWRPDRIGAGSAGYGHVPFAHWIVRAVKPRTLIELGTHNGVSYSAFCEAVVRSGLDTRCFAVDNWRGDAHSGHYGEDGYLDFRRFRDSRYGAFSELLRCTFDDAFPSILDAGLDLLHIDGFHTYEAVKDDFENWCNTLSDRAVVLFHHTNVRERDVGVWRFWEEIRTKFPSFEFLHGHGLGVLAVGPSISPQVSALCSVREPACVHAIRERFSLLGERWILDARGQLQEREIAARDSRILSLEAEVLPKRSSEHAQRNVPRRHVRAIQSGLRWRSCHKSQKSRGRNWSNGRRSVPLCSVLKKQSETLRLRHFIQQIFSMSQIQRTIRQSLRKHCARRGGFLPRERINHEFSTRSPAAQSHKSTADRTG
jgi:hypothetical protein